MKKNSEPLSLEQLLASVEHAGRDSRRQQQLSAMIERMADDEAKKRRTFRMWAVPLAAAATVTLFVITSVWQWEDPMQPAGPQLAQAPAVCRTELPLPQTKQQQPITMASVQHRAAVEDGTLPLPGIVTATPAQPLVMEVVEPVMPQEEYLAEALPEETDTLYQGNSHPVVPADELSQLAQAPAEPKTSECSRSFFSFFHAEPSLMDGTVLAFNIL